MISIKIDGAEITDKEELHGIFRQALDLKDYYGSNLDALYDVLSTYSQKIEISIVNPDDLYSNIPFYGERFMSVLQVAAQENESNIIIKMNDKEPEEDLW